MSQKKSIDRRQFLKTSTMGMIGAGLAAQSGCKGTKTAEEESTPEVSKYRVLGRTGFKVLDLGTGSIQDEGVLRAALDAGFNFIDTAEQYPGHHKIVGQAIKGLDRKSLFIATKLEMKGDITKEGIIKRTHKGLEEMETEYVDCMMMHFPEKIETLSTPGFHEAMQELKSEGRVRSVGASHHGSFWFTAPEQSMKDILLAAAEDGRFDVFLMAYNFLQIDQGAEILRVCGEKNIGVALMKTKPASFYQRVSAMVEKLKKEGKDVHPLYQEGLDRYKVMLEKGQDFLKKHNLENPDDINAAAVLFSLENPNVHTVCCSVRTFDELAMFTRLSGSRLSDMDKLKLAAFKKECGPLYCRHACGQCELQCPHGVPVNTIQRYHHYFVAQGREKEAMQYYANIPGVKADLCSSCSGHCESACPYGVPIQGKQIMAHHDLSLV